MNDLIEEYEIGQCLIKIHYDEDAESPRADDNLGTIVSWHRRHHLGDEQPTEDAGEYLINLARRASRKFDRMMDRFETLDRSGHDGPVFDKALARVKEEREAVLDRHYARLPLYLYDHSGITISTGPFSCPFDSGQVGFIYCSLQKARENWVLCKSAGWKYLMDEWMDGDRYIGDEQKKLPKAQRKKVTLRDATIRALEQEVSHYDDFLTGQCFGYVVEAENGEEESCWGFVGDIDYVKKDAEQAAKRLNAKMDEEDRVAALTEHETAMASTLP